MYYILLILILYTSTIDINDLIRKQEPTASQNKIVKRDNYKPHRYRIIELIERIKQIHYLRCLATYVLNFL